MQTVQQINRELVISGHKIQFTGSDGAYYWNVRGPFETITHAIQDAINQLKRKT